MFMISEAVRAFFDMLNGAFLMNITGMKQKPTLEVVKDKKSLKKGTDYAEKIIDLVDKYEDKFDPKDLKKYRSLKTKFRKYN